MAEQIIMNRKNVGLGLALISLSILLPWQAGNKSIAQETGKYVNLEQITENPQELMGHWIADCRL